MQYKPVIIGVVIVSLVALVMLILAFMMNKERVIAQPKEKVAKGETKQIVTGLFKTGRFWRSAWQVCCCLQDKCSRKVFICTCSTTISESLG